MMYICITGRESEIANAELEAVFGKVSAINKEVSVIDEDTLSIDTLYKLGFTKEIAQVCKTESEMASLAEDIAGVILENSTKTTGKISFGISWYSSQRCDQRTYLNLSKSVKKQLQAYGRSARFIAPKDVLRLNAAQIQHNSLLKKGSQIVISDGENNKLVVSKTIWAFNPTNYSKRDYDRPVRPTRVGMFPPKLAQVLINLAQPKPDQVVVDPFCGSGVVLQEAMYDEHNVVGSDNSNEMVTSSMKNLTWFKQEFSNQRDFEVFSADARNFTAPNQPYVVVSEGYLGPNFSREVGIDDVSTIRGDLSQLYIDFLTKAWNSQKKPSSIVITLPVWKSSNEILYLNIIDQILSIGYTIRQFQSVGTKKLVYRRDQQIVGREILVLDCKTR